MSENIFVFTLILVFGTVITVAALRYRSRNIQAKARLESDEAYRLLAEQSAASLAATATLLATMQATLAEVHARVGSVEKVLKEVE